jgi:hypothetical protein
MHGVQRFIQCHLLDEMTQTNSFENCSYPSPNNPQRPVAQHTEQVAGRQLLYAASTELLRNCERLRALPLLAHAPRGVCVRVQLAGLAPAALAHIFGQFHCCAAATSLLLLAGCSFPKSCAHQHCVQRCASAGCSFPVQQLTNSYTNNMFQQQVQWMHVTMQACHAGTQASECCLQLSMTHHMLSLGWQAVPLHAE